MRQHAALVAISAIVSVGCGRTQPPPTVAAIVPALARRAASPELARSAKPTFIMAFDACPDGATARLLVGEEDLFWSCSNGVIGHRSLATGSQETVLQLPGELWLALDADHLYVSQQTAGGTARLFSVPRKGGAIATLGSVPPGRLVADGSSVWIGVLKNPPATSISPGLYRVSTTGAGAQLVLPGAAIAVGSEGPTITFVQADGPSYKQWTLSTLDVASLATKRVRVFAAHTAFVVGGDYAYVGGFGVNLKSGKSTKALSCSDLVAATKTRVLVRCADGSVRVADHGSETLTTLPDVPKADQPLFIGPRHVCWPVGKVRDKVQCVA